MKLLFKIVCLIVLTSFIWSCDKKVQKVNHKFNTKITINFKNLSSKRGLYFQSYDTLPINSYSIIKPPIHKVTETKNSITYNFYLAKPRELLLGFSKFYIQPNDDFVLNYEVFKDNKYYFEDKFEIVSGNGILLTENGQDPYSNNNFENQYFNAKSKIEIDAFLNESVFINEANKVFAKMKLDYIGKSYEENIRKHLQCIYSLDYLSGVLFKSKTTKTKFDINLQEYANQKTGVLILDFEKSKIEKFAYHKNWNLYYQYYEVILFDLFKSKNFLKREIDSKINKFEYLSQQYLYFLVANSISKTENINVDNFKSIASAITYAPFKNEIKKINVDDVFRNQIPENLKTTTFFDTNLKTTTFDLIFKNTPQKYLYFDFCGSWCMPCIKEIKEYSKTKKFDNSKNVRPIWIFFENDKTAWFKVIERFNLKKENCFLINSKDVPDFNKNFGRNYNWRGEFPHHSLFNKNGKLKDDSPRSLEMLTEKDFK